MLYLFPLMSKNNLGMYSEEFEKDACGIGLIYAGLAEQNNLTVSRGLAILANLSHRSALGADGKTSDGAGILLQLDLDYFRNLSELKDKLSADQLAVGMLFFSSSHDVYLHEQKKKVEVHARGLGLTVQAWRRVPVDSSVLGAQAKEIEPQIFQVFFSENVSGADSFEKKAFLLKNDLQRTTLFDVISLSTKTIVYKGLSLPADLGNYYLDLKTNSYQSRFAMVHSRFSTNTLPAWKLAQPFSTICHNGEINTLRGNLTWLRAKEQQITEFVSPKDPHLLRPLILPGQSDSQYLDDTVSIFGQSGYLLPKALMTLMPDAFSTDPNLKAFYDVQSVRVEPWDGPAAVCFCDGDWLGAKLDRNGLRPCRYQILQDGTLVLGSEIGILPVNLSEVKIQGRLGPGQMIAIDINTNQIFMDSEIKSRIAKTEPYENWLKEERHHSVAFAEPKLVESFDFEKLFRKLNQFGYTREEIETVLIPMYLTCEEASSSMGNDTPQALLSDKPQLLFNYFRQMFAQVTNPPMDSIRESLVMSLNMFLGPKPHLLDQKKSNTKVWKLDQPVLSEVDFHRLLKSEMGLNVGVVSILKTDSAWSLDYALEQFCKEAESLALMNDVIVLSDLGVSSDAIAIPSLLALSAVHSHLIKKQLRTKVSLVVASHEIRDVHHFACLIGYGAEAVYPFLMKDLAAYLQKSKILITKGLAPDLGTLVINYTKAINKGLLKIISKMGISTLQSYCGAQVFEIVGLSSDIVEKYFPGTVSRIEGMTLEMIDKEARLFQSGVLPKSLVSDSSGLPTLSLLSTGGVIHYRENEENHLWNPNSISSLQEAARSNSLDAYNRFKGDVQKNSKSTLRGFLKFKSSKTAIPIDEVEPIVSILRRFTTGAMSLGALGKEAHESLAIAMNRMGAKSNSGEGGESADRFLPDANGDLRNSSIKQVASARFGVTAHYLANAQELQIKMAQGAKPGEGGHLPGHKVDTLIAKLRHATPGVTLISPPPHHDIYSIEDLAQLIFDLKKSNPEARISVKLVAEAGIGTVAAGVAKALAHKIVISGDSGGTGASPYSSIKYAGIPWEMGLSEAHQTLVRNGLRDRVKLETDGQLKTGIDVVTAAMLGADEFGFSTAPLIAQGCIMMRKCHLNTCPVGIATQDLVLRARFAGQPEHVINYFYFVAEDVRQIMADLGVRSFVELIGQTQMLDFKVSQEDIDKNYKLAGLDLGKLIEPAQCLVKGNVVGDQSNESKLSDSVEEQISEWAKPALTANKKLTGFWQINNTQRALGTLLSNTIVKQFGADGLKDNQLTLKMAGVAGQSYGAFLARGITMSLQGSANDYVGKGLSGGRIIISPSLELKAESGNLVALVGNTCLYGATSGDVFFAGTAGERFAVRNSGARAIVEGLGDHGCEYMTGGEVIVLGSIGKNFAAGMSGGIAYVFDPLKDMFRNCNLATVELIWDFEQNESDYLKDRIGQHATETNSKLAQSLLDNWALYKQHFVKIFPTDLKKILLQQTVQPRRLGFKNIEREVERA